MAELDETAAGLIAATKEFIPLTIGKIPLADARALAEMPTPVPGADVASVEDRVLNTAVGEVPVRVYDHSPDVPGKPVVQYMHGGGWSVGGPNSSDGLCRELAVQLGAVVISVDYPLAPEHPFPAAPEASFAVYLHLLETVADLAGDPRRIAVAGDSAGGNIAAAMCLMAKDRGVQQPLLQWLIYPATTYTDWTLPSMKENAGAEVIDAQDVDYFFRLYVPNEGDSSNAYVSPALAADHRALAPALIHVADADCLRDDGIAYGELLEAARVPVRVSNIAGMPHGFFMWLGVHPQASVALGEAVEHLGKAFAG